MVFITLVCLWYIPIALQGHQTLPRPDKHGVVYLPARLPHFFSFKPFTYMANQPDNMPTRL
jgi:hypothetical protein